MDLSFVCAITDASPYKSVLCPMMWRLGSETDKVPPNTSPYGLRPLSITATEFVGASHNLLWGWQNHTRMCIDAQVHDGARYPRLRVFIQDLSQCHANPRWVRSPIYQYKTSHGFFEVFSVARPEVAGRRSRIFVTLHAEYLWIHWYQPRYLIWSIILIMFLEFTNAARPNWPLLGKITPGAAPIDSQTVQKIVRRARTHSCATHALWLTGQSSILSTRGVPFLADKESKYSFTHIYHNLLWRIDIEASLSGKPLIGLAGLDVAMVKSTFFIDISHRGRLDFQSIRLSCTINKKSIHMYCIFNWSRINRASRNVRVNTSNSGCIQQ